ncbi:MAG: hypothetical protein ABSE73_21565 [Planctomycetota bacterium]
MKPKLPKSYWSKAWKREKRRRNCCTVCGKPVEMSKAYCARHTVMHRNYVRAAVGAKPRSFGGVTIDDPKAFVAKQREARDLYKQGKSTTEIAKAFSCTLPTVRRSIRAVDPTITFTRRRRRK